MFYFLGTNSADSAWVCKQLTYVSVVNLFLWGGVNGDELLPYKSVALTSCGLLSFSGSGQGPGGEQVSARRASLVYLRPLGQRVGQPGELVHPAQGALAQHEVDDTDSPDLVSPRSE